MGFEEEFQEMRKKIDQMLRSFFQSKTPDFGNPFVYGFSVRVGKDGVPKIKEFGSMRPTVEGRDPSEREPVYDVIDGEEEVYVTVDLPGTTPERIKLRSSERILTVEAEGFRRYWKVLELPDRVEPRTLTWTFNNGVLDVCISKSSKKLKPSSESL